MNLLHKCILLISMVFVFLFSMMTVNVSAGQPAEKKLRYRNILLRDFRTVKDGQVINFNIGTAAHAPATLAVLKKYLPPEVKITVWADAPLAPELAEMMARRFPEVLIVHGDLNNAPPAELLKAVDEADLFLVSSGSTITAAVGHSMDAFLKRTGKPAAAYAIGCTPRLLPRLDHLDFVWLRDPIAAEIAKKSRCPIQGWAPDAVFDFDAVDKKSAERFMKEKGLTPGQFICCIPGQRYTPRWQFFNIPENLQKVAENRKFEEHDNAVLREVIRIAVTEYGLKVLICPEQITEIALIRPRIFDRLPPEIQKNCVTTDKMWSPDVALGVYRASRGVFGVEIHSQVMAVGSGVPGVVLAPPQFGSKSEMWKSIGLPEWLIYTDSPDYAEKVVAVSRDILSFPEKNAAKLQRARKIINTASRNAIHSSFFQ
ncbi:MAG: polysaccharide pyruvyl transferase family protein [Lentisphaeria bacterium]|nr:polysaccharide pyruvyl transferase family protein [Lentisphaeria bacterium]